MTQANNVIMLVGRLGSDPEMKTIGDKSLAIFSLAVDRSIKDANGNKVTDWFKCELWGKQADILNEYASKGSQISVVGSARKDIKEINGEKKTFDYVSVSNFQLLGSKDSNQAAPAPAAEKPPVKAVKTPKAAEPSIAELEDDIPPF